MVGGFVKEYQVLIDPNRLRAYDIPLSRITEAVRVASGEVGGRVIEQGETKLMTVGVIIGGLLPIFFTDGLGSDVMRRIALPMVGGMASTTVLTLIVIPVVYYLWEGRRFRRVAAREVTGSEADYAPKPAE